LRNQAPQLSRFTRVFHLRFSLQQQSKKPSIMNHSNKVGQQFN
jgi:hypothetical protein